MLSDIKNHHWQHIFINRPLYWLQPPTRKKKQKKQTNRKVSSQLWWGWGCRGGFFTVATKNAASERRWGRHPVGTGRRALVDSGFFISFILFIYFKGWSSRELTHILQITCTRRINTSDVPMEATRLWQNVHLLLFFLFFSFFQFTYSRKWATDHKSEEKLFQEKSFLPIFFLFPFSFFFFRALLAGWWRRPPQKMHFQEGGALLLFRHVDMQWCPWISFLSCFFF